MRSNGAKSAARLRISTAALGVAVAALLVLVVPAAALSAPAFPVQSAGDRGSDVTAIQLLLRARGVSIAPDGVFGPSTSAALRAFQAARGLAATGVADDATWSALVMTVGPGRAFAAARRVSRVFTSFGDAVRALQVQLNAKRSAGIAVDGILDADDLAALTAFQKHAGLVGDGIAWPPVWRSLVRHFEYPRFQVGRLCDYSVGNGTANWGTSEMTAVLRAASQSGTAGSFGAIALGDVSLEHGGPIPGHLGHQHGLEADIRPIRADRAQCRGRTNWRASSYDRTATRALIKAIRAAAPGHVKLIYFNDPRLIAEGLTRRMAGHDDHLHVRLCEAQHPVAAHRC